MMVRVGEASALRLKAHSGWPRPVVDGDEDLGAPCAPQRVNRLECGGE